MGISVSKIGVLCGIGYAGIVTTVQPVCVDEDCTEDLIHIRYVWASETVRTQNLKVEIVLRSNVFRLKPLSFLGFT